MFKQLLVPLDGSSLAEEALDAAASIARHDGSRIDVMMVHPASSVRGSESEFADAMQLETEDSYLERIVNELSRGSAIRATHGLLKGDVAKSISARAHDVKADLILITSHGRTGLSRSWLGSVADGLIRNAAIPVLMLRSHERKQDRAAAHRRFRRILVLLDGSRESEEILSAATSLGVCNKADLVLLRIAQPVPLATASAGMLFGTPDIGIPLAIEPMQDVEATEECCATAMQELRRVAEVLTSSAMQTVETHVVVAEHVAPAIIDFIETHAIDAIAMCTHGRGASRLLMGSVADKILQGTHLPILAYRSVVA